MTHHMHILEFTTVTYTNHLSIHYRCMLEYTGFLFFNRPNDYVSSHILVLLLK